MSIRTHALALALALLSSACGSSNASGGEPQTVLLSVAGMDCGGCANSLRTLLSEVQGVESVEVDHEQNRASVVCSASTDPEGLVRTVNEKSKLIARVLPR